MRPQTLCTIAVLALAACGAYSTTGAPAAASAASGTSAPTAEPPAVLTPPATSSAPKSDSNVVVLNAEAKWWSDKALDRHIGLSLKEADLKTAVAALAKASGLNIVASGAKAGQKASVQIQDAPLRDVMRTLSGLYHMRWHKTGDVYSLQPETTGKFLPVSAFRQQTRSGIQGLKITRGSRGYTRWPLGVRRPKPVRMRTTR